MSADSVSLEPDARAPRGDAPPSPTLSREGSTNPAAGDFGALSSGAGSPAEATVAYSCRWLALAACALVLSAAVFVGLDRREEARAVAERALASELQVLAQRIALNAPGAAAGDARSVDILQASGQRFAAVLGALGPAGVSEREAKAADSVGLDARSRLTIRWSGVRQHWARLLEQRAAVDSMVIGLQALTTNSQPLSTLVQRLANAASDSRLEPAVSGLVRQLEVNVGPARLAHASLAMSVNPPDASVLGRLGDDLAAAQSTLRTVLSQNPPAAVRDSAEALRDALAQLAAEVKRLTDGTQAVMAARAAAREIVAASEDLSEDAARLGTTFVAAAPAASRYLWAALAAGAAALACLLWIGRIVLTDAERRAAQSLQSEVRARKANQRTQEAILRLLDEMSHLADGDLTVRANVTDEVTGAVADAINYAVGELRRLVLDINEAAERLAAACGQAQAMGGELLDASQRQAQEIVATTAAVAAVTRSVTDISDRAAESAQVAETSLQAAERGSSSVRRSIAGIEVIRQQMQETAKRIKRLGESAQEIGATVDLIGDIGERTNVLALNAAIQANAAGTPGRGFGLVAEEVRRLAERSAQAAGQIDAIVKVIQSDTQDATSAMERSTERVVEQTQLARGAAEALTHIDQLSRQLAELTEAISAATRAQCEAAEHIHAAMAEIARISALTSDGTRQSAERTVQLAQLARGLKQSVAGFKVS